MHVAPKNLHPLQNRHQSQPRHTHRYRLQLLNPIRPQLQLHQPTNTPIPTPTSAPPTPEPTQVAPTATATESPDPTPIPPTNTPEPTATPVPPTNTPVPTATPIPPTPTTAIPTATPTAVPQVVATPTEIPLEAPKPAPVTGTKGGEIIVAIPQAPPHQDIHKSVSPILAAWGPGITYSRLFRYQWIEPGDPHQGIDALNNRYLPSNSTSARQVICDLCESWQLDTNYNLTVNLKPDVKWQDANPGIGRNLAASDVAYSLNRLKDPTFANSPLVNTVADATAIDDSTVIISLTLPDAEIFDKLADARAAIVAKEAVQLNGDLNQGPTIGTGPWIMDLFTPSAMRFSANDDYFIPELPLLDGIIVAVIEDAQTRTTALRTRQLDLIQPDVKDLIAAAERFDDLRWNQTHDPSAGIEVAFNTTRNPFGVHNMRTAIMFAWDPNSMIDTLHKGQSFISAGLPLNHPDWLLPESEIDTYFNNPDKIPELIGDARIAIVIEVTIRVGQFGDEYIQTANSLADAMRKIGFYATVEPISTRTFGEDVWLNADYDVYVGAPPPQTSATSMLFAIHHSAAPRNTTGYSSNDLDVLIERQAVELNAKVRRELMLEIQREILRGSHIVRAAANVSHWLWWSHLNNVAPSTFRADSFWLTRIWLNQ